MAINLSKSSNPFLGNKAFGRAQALSRDGVMTLNGVVNKTAILLLTAIVTASITYKMGYAGNSMTMPLSIGGAISAFIFALVGMFKPETTRWSAPVYAISEGLFLGGISAMFSMAYGGIVLQAVLLTFGVFLIMLFAYRTGIIKPTKKFMMGVFAATGAIGVVYLVNIVASMFGVNLPILHEPSPLGIGISLVIVVVAALNLILDFKFIEDRIAMGAPKHMEWFSAMGLMITLVWLYIELLRLLAMFAGRE